MKSSKTNPIDFLRNIPLFTDLREPELLRLGSMVERRKINKYGFIYQIGDSSDTIYFLIKGIVKTGTHSEEGREVIKQVFHPIAMFGELGIVNEVERKDFARAMNQAVELYALQTSDLKKLMTGNANLTMRLLDLIGKRLQNAEHRLESMIFKDARERIIDFLKESASRRGKKIGYEMLINHCLTQQDIANITGTSRQTVTSVLNDLKKSNLIYFNRRSILIRDLGKLA